MLADVRAKQHLPDRSSVASSKGLRPVRWVGAGVGSVNSEGQLCAPLAIVQGCGQPANER